MCENIISLKQHDDDNYFDPHQVSVGGKVPGGDRAALCWRAEPGKIIFFESYSSAVTSGRRCSAFIIVADGGRAAGWPFKCGENTKYKLSQS